MLNRKRNIKAHLVEEKFNELNNKNTFQSKDNRPLYNVNKFEYVWRGGWESQVDRGGTSGSPYG